MRKLLFTILAVISFTSAFAQTDSVRRVKYTPDFRFKPGIYLNFSQFHENNPIPAIRIISSDDPSDFNFFRNLVKNKTISYFDEFGTRRDVSTSAIWGYCQDGRIFIHYNDEFNRMPIIGRVCHFIADVTVIDTHYDPYYDYYSGYYNPYYMRPYNRTTRTQEMHQYLLDFETGKVMDFDRQSVMVLLMQDPELYDEFMKIKKRKQNDLLFFFLRRLNEKYPVMIPLR
jgi:hypothetical protein